MDRHHDCGSSCSSTRHLDELTAAMTKGSSAQLVALLPRCFNHLKGKDSIDRTVLHVAASCGKCLVLRWLLRRRGAPVNDADGESGWTPLHRAIFYGQLSCARLLLSNGASLSSPLDSEGLAPIDLLAADKFPHVTLTASEPMEVFTWGSNLNYTLGHPTNQSKETPDCIESLRKSGVGVTSVHLDKFHSAFLGVDGRVFVCGYGQGGRLGLGKGDNVSCLVPRRVESLDKEKCVEVAIGQDHSLFLTESGSLYGCGSNTKGQLGLTKSPGGNAPPPNCAEPKSIALKFLKGEKIARIACGKEYSVIIGGRFSLFACGANHGQFGFLSSLKTSLNEGTLTSQLAESPANLDAGFVWLKVSDLISKEKSCEIVDVVCAESAIAVSTNRGDIYLLANHKLRKIETPKYFTPQVIRLSANKSLDATNNAVSYHLLVLTMTNKLFSWRSGDPKMRRCLFKESLGGREIYLVDVCLSRQGLICVSENGFAFSGVFAAGKPKDGKSAKEGKNSEKRKEDLSAKNSPTPLHRGKNSSSSSSPAPFVSAAFSHPMVPFLNPDECQRVIAKRIPFVTRAVKCVSDAKGENFAVLQTHPANGVTQIIDLTSSEMTSHFQSFFADSCSSSSSFSDVTSDVVLKVAHRRFNAHKFILASRSEYFRKLFEKESDANAVSLIDTEETEYVDDDEDDSEEASPVDEDAVEDDDDDPFEDSESSSFFDLDTFVGGGEGGDSSILFAHILEFLYTDSCDFLREGKKIPPLKREREKERKTQEEEFFDVDDLSKSAFSALKDGGEGKGKKGEQKGGKKKSGKGGGGGVKTPAHKPLEAMKSLTRKFGLKALSKQLEAIYLDEKGIVNKIRYKVVNPPKLRLERTKHKWAYDVILKSEDGVCYPCHRCVLVSRLEFFSAMFSSGWLETSTTTESRSGGKRQPKQALPMPFKADVLEVLLRFIYADDALALDDPNRGDLCFHVLVAADQLLIARLKSLCEFAIADHVMTLKNAAEVLQFAVTYNASGLRDRAAQFLCLNIATLLEKKALDGLCHEAMEHLTKTYQSSHPSLCYRRLTPHHVDIDLTRFDASGRKDFASLLQEEDDLKVEELTDEEEAVGGGGGGGTGKGSSFSAKKKRERKVSWNDGGTSRDGTTDRRRKLSRGGTPDSSSTNLGVGTLLSSKLKGSKLRTTSIGEENCFYEGEAPQSPVLSTTTTTTTTTAADRRSATPPSFSKTLPRLPETGPDVSRTSNGVSTRNSASNGVSSGNTALNGVSAGNTVSTGGPAPIPKSFFDSYVNSIEKRKMTGLRSVMDEERENKKSDVALKPVDGGGGGGFGGDSDGSSIGRRGGDVAEKTSQPMPKMSWASKSVTSDEISPVKEELSSSMSKSFKELMIEDLKKGGGGEAGVAAAQTTTGKKTITYSATSVADNGGGGGDQPTKTSKRKISFGLMGDHQQLGFSKEKSKSKETIGEEKPLEITPSNPWTNFQSKDDGLDGVNGGGSGGKSPAGRKNSLNDSSLSTTVASFGTSSGTATQRFHASSSTDASSQHLHASSTAVSLSRVIHEEAEAKERWKRETKKSLQLIQIEEQALKELRKHYEMVYGRDGEEMIHVERAVEDYVWQPLWRMSGDVE